MVKVCGIIGHNFCGSTLLSWLLGSHSEIFPLGESHHLVEELSYENARKRYGGRPVGCYYHGETCPVFPHADLPYPARNFHRMVAKKLGASILADESKLTRSFRVYEENDSADEYAYVILFKRPEGFLHSYLKRDNGHKVSFLAHFYSQSYGKAEEFTRGKPRVFLPYERFCEDVPGSLEKIATILKIDPAGFDVENYHKTKWHPTGGNTRVVVDKAPIELREPWRDDPPEADNLSWEVLRRAHEGLMLLAEQKG